MRVTAVQGKRTGAQAAFRRKHGITGRQVQADHTLDLQLGADELFNIMRLDGSVNTSVGKHERR